MSSIAWPCACNECIPVLDFCDVCGSPAGMICVSGCSDHPANRKTCAVRTLAGSVGTRAALIIGDPSLDGSHECVCTVQWDIKEGRWCAHDGIGGSAVWADSRDAAVLASFAERLNVTGSLDAAYKYERDKS